MPGALAAVTRGPQVYVRLARFAQLVLTASLYSPFTRRGRPRVRRAGMPRRGSPAAPRTRPAAASVSPRRPAAARKDANRCRREPHLAKYYPHSSCAVLPRRLDGIPRARAALQQGSVCCMNLIVHAAAKIVRTPRGSGTAVLTRARRAIKRRAMMSYNSRSRARCGTRRAPYASSARAGSVHCPAGSIW